MLGCMAALFSAASWALGGVLWRKIGDHISPYSMNLCKGVLGGIYIGIVLLIVGIDPVHSRDFIILGISGLIGISLGDTFFFMSLMQLGPRHAALMGALNPVAITIAAVVFLGERPASLVWLGIICTIGGIAWVLLGRLPHKTMVKSLKLGIRFSLLSVVCTAAGVILAKIGLRNVSSLQATFIRLMCGAAGLTIWGLLRGHFTDWVKPFKDTRILKSVIGINLIVIFGGFWLSIYALKYIDASVAGPLNSLAPVLILPMVMIAFGENIPLRAVWGTLLAVLGVSLILMGY